MVKIEKGKRKIYASLWRRSVMASDWSNYIQVPNTLSFEEISSGYYGKERITGRVTKLMYAAQQGDIHEVNTILKSQVSRSQILLV